MVHCRSYTHARRFPRVLGNIQGLRLPVPWSMSQVGVWLVSVMLLVFTRGIWAHLTPLGNGLMIIGLPWALGRWARNPRLEGRAAWRAAIGWLQLLSAQIEQRFSPHNKEHQPVRVRCRVPVEVQR